MIHFRPPGVHQIHSGAAALAAHHWYPDRHSMKEYAGKELLVSDEVWQKYLADGHEVSHDSAFRRRGRSYLFAPPFF
jgi:hypothetical protein